MTERFHDIALTVNGEEVRERVDARSTLVDFLRDELRLTGTHIGCDTTHCGACTVILNGELVKSCTILAAMTEGHEVRTVESLEVDGVLDPVQRGFMECHGLQCGFCTPGMLLTAQVLLEQTPDPTEDEIREHLSGNVCRCTGYAGIVASVREAARLLREEHA